MALVLLSWKAAAAEPCCSADIRRQLPWLGRGRRSGPRELFTLERKKQRENVSLL